MMELNRTQKEIINYIITENEGTQFFGKTDKYLRAFSGKFTPNMPFTFYFISITRPIMYVYDPKNKEHRNSRAVFNTECNQKKQKILDITGFYEYLTEHDYVRRCYKGLRDRQELPKNYDEIWRKYSDFYSNIVSGLTFVCLADFLPKLKLYKLWKSINA